MKSKRYSKVILAVITIFLTFLGIPHIFAQERLSKNREETIKVDVDLVLVNAAVTPPHLGGQFLSDRENDQFIPEGIS